jgi:hypothetical protein
MLASIIDQCITKSFDLNNVIDLFLVIDMCRPKRKMIDNLQYNVWWQIQWMKSNTNIEQYSLNIRPLQ